MKTSENKQSERGNSFERDHPKYRTNQASSLSFSFIPELVSTLPHRGRRKKTTVINHWQKSFKTTTLKKARKSCWGKSSPQHPEDGQRVLPLLVSPHTDVGSVCLLRVPSCCQGCAPHLQGSCSHSFSLSAGIVAGQDRTGLRNAQRGHLQGLVCPGELGEGKMPPLPQPGVSPASTHGRDSTWGCTTPALHKNDWLVCCLVCLLFGLFVL